MSDMPPPPPDDISGSSQPPPPPESPQHNPQAVTGWATLGTGGGVELASPGARLGARVLDFIIMIVGYLILALIGFSAAFGGDFEEDALSAGAFLAAALIFGIVGVLYEVTLIAVRGQTLGKMATSIKVVRADNGLVPGWGKSVGRWIIPAALGFIPLVGWILSLLVYLSLLWDRVRQGWHDKAAGTLVVKV